MTAKEISKISERLVLTKGELADMLGVSAFTLRRWEKGLTKPRPSNMRKLIIISRGKEPWWFVNIARSQITPIIACAVVR